MIKWYKLSVRKVPIAVDCPDLSRADIFATGLVFLRQVKLFEVDQHLL